MTVPVPRYLPRPIRTALNAYNAGDAIIPYPRFINRGARTLFAAINERLPSRGPGELPVPDFLPRALRVAGLDADAELDVPTGPEWLPAGAVAFADFANAHYYMGGAEVSASDMFESNQSYAGFDFSESFISAGQGFVGSATAARGGAFKGAALSAFVSGASFVIDFAMSNTTNPAPGITFETVQDTNYSTDYIVIADRLDTQLGDANGVISFTGKTPYSAGSNKIAATFDPGVKLAYALNGTLLGSASDPVAGDPLNLAYFMISSGSGQKATIRSITVYAPKADTALETLTA